MYTLNELLILGSNHEGINNINSLPCDYRLGKTEYIIELTLHRGETGFVYLGRDSAANHKVVIKEFFPRNEFKYEGDTLSFKRNSNMEVILAKSDENKELLFHELKKMYVEEAECFRKVFTEKPTARVIDTINVNNTRYVVLEYIPYPTLNSVLKNCDLTPGEASLLFVRILNSVYYVHQKGYAHKEIKPTNVYVADSSVILGDFSFSNHFRQSITNHSSIYTNIFSAPEQNDPDKPQGTRTDIYSLGKLLEYIMDSIGYHKKNQLNGYQNFRTDKVEYLIDNCTKVDPEERVDSVYEMITLLQTRVEDKKRKTNLYVMSFAGLLIVVIVMIAIKPFFSAMLQDHEKSEIKEVLVQVKEPIIFAGTNRTFAFAETKIINWENSGDSSYYEIQIKYQDSDCCLFKALKVNEEHLDLDCLSLNPGLYTLIVSDPLDKKEVELNFTILDDENIVNKEKSVLSYDQYSFYDYESQIIEWTNCDDKYTNMKIVNLGDMEIVGDSIIEQNFVDLKMFNLKPGDYLISVQNIEGNLESYYECASVSIKNKYGIKNPVLVMKNNTEFNQDGIIEWMPTGTPIEIEIKDSESDEVVYITTSENSNYVTIKDLNLSDGIYDISIHYGCEKGYSEVTVKRFTLSK